MAQYINREKLLKRMEGYCKANCGCKPHEDALCPSCGLGDAIYMVEEQRIVNSKNMRGRKDATVALSKMEKTTRWIPVTERLPECDLGAEVGNIEWISCGMVHAGCFGRGGKYRDAYFRTWTDAGEGMDANGADYWRTVTLPEPPKEEG